MLKIRARIVLADDAGKVHGQRAFSGMQPSMDIDGGLVACKVVRGELSAPIPRAEAVEVLLGLPYGEEFEEKLRSGYRFNLNVASRVLGSGVIL